ncbi:MAG TPA: type II toxin-antitoxin system VapC family toxin [Methanothrix sp.]|nr:type II toxin-antitoxin system VapC family toxin [Methanothrix sp.]
MNNRVEDIRKKYYFSKDEKFFLDTNIWIYLYYGQYPYDNKYFRKYYTDAFEKMRLNRCKIYLDAFVLSEFIRVFSHLEFNRIIPYITRKDPNKNYYKLFRESEKGRQTSKEIVLNMNKILKEAQLCDLDYNFINLQNQLIEYGKISSDFNDLTYIKLCKKHGYTLVTHDGDFHNCGVPVLTANNKLLGSY